MKIKSVCVTALGLALLAGFPAYGEEDRTPVGEITLSVSSDIEAGMEGGEVYVEVEEGSCHVDSVEIVNMPGVWAGGDEPKVKIWLNADDDCYFDKSGKSIFTFTGDEVKYNSASRKNDKETLVLTITLEELEDGDLDVNGLVWNEEYAIASWDENPEAKNYRVRLYRDDTGVGSVRVTTQTSYDFSSMITRPGRYSFRVRAFDRRDNAGDWEESSILEVSAQDVASYVGAWRRDDRGWWYENPDHSYTVNGWQMIQEQWYYFGPEGYMETGWIQDQGKYYYCDPLSGAMWKNCTTPDGYTLGEDGARL